MSSPQAEGIVANLRQDAFARAVLDRVESGPYVRIALSFVPVRLTVCNRARIVAYSELKGFHRRGFTMLSWVQI